jgi:chromate transporter
MAASRQHPTLLELFLVFLRVSALTIGGGYVMFPLLKREVVDGKGWLSDEEMVDYYALGQSITGIIAMNTAALIGYRKSGIPGAIAAAAGMAAPSVVVIIFIAAFLVPYFDLPWVQKAFAGVRAAVVAMIVMAVLQVAKKSVNTVSGMGIAAGSFLAIVGVQMHPVPLILLGALLGFLLYRNEEPA